MALYEFPDQSLTKHFQERMAERVPKKVRSALYRKLSALAAMPIGDLFRAGEEKLYLFLMGYQVVVATSEGGLRLITVFPINDLQ